ARHSAWQLHSSRTGLLAVRRGVEDQTTALALFFQAEDGIRAGHVTGVQTCALPISLRFGAKVPGPIMQQGAVDMCFNYADYFGRSEERRVGKECRSGRWPRHSQEHDKNGAISPCIWLRVVGALRRRGRVGHRRTLGA